MLPALIASVLLAQLAQITAPPPITDAFANALADTTYSGEVKLTVSPSGAIIRCAIIVSGGSAKADRAVCVSMLKVVASAAKMGDGSRAYGEIFTNVKSDGAKAITIPPDVELEIEKFPLGLPAHPQTTLILTIDPAAHVIACDVRSSSGSASLDKAACSSGPAAAPPIPANDERGAPVVTVKTFIVGFGPSAKAVKD